MTTTVEQSIELAATLAPVPDEITAVDLPVTGAVPPELDGRYLRNGPNPLPGEHVGHWFTGHGMLHGVRLSGGRARWYRNRWVRTSRLSGAPFLTDRGPDLRVNSANTHVIEHAGTLLALCEGGLPYRVSGDLETVGCYDFGGRLQTAMTAHPKTDPLTGELYFYGYAATWPYLTFHVADATGQLVRSLPVEVPGPTMMHDFAITEHHVIWLDLPVTFDRSSFAAGGMPFTWSDNYGARIGVMAKTGGPVRWIEIEPCYVFHVGNAREDVCGRIVLDAIRYSPEAFGAVWSSIGTSRHPEGHAAQAARAGVSVLYRWTIDPRTGQVHEAALDDRESEFPSLNDSHVGRSNRYLYAVGNEGGGRVIKYDLKTGASTDHRPAVDSRVGEAVFVPGRGQVDGSPDGAQEDAGWLLTIVTPEDGSASELLILDATDVAAGPVARVHLPRRVPAGFHGSWIPEH